MKGSVFVLLLSVVSISSTFWNGIQVGVLEKVENLLESALKMTSCNDSYIEVANETWTTCTGDVKAEIENAKNMTSNTTSPMSLLQKIELLCEFQTAMFTCHNDLLQYVTPCFRPVGQNLIKVLTNLMTNGHKYLCEDKKLYEFFQASGTNCIEQNAQQLSACVPTSALAQIKDVTKLEFTPTVCKTINNVGVCAAKALSACNGAVSENMFKDFYSKVVRTSVPCSSAVTLKFSPTVIIATLVLLMKRFEV